MGNPAGLKLNRPLNKTLGNFFLYHIYLWQTYMTFVSGALADTIEWTAGLVGAVGGLSCLSGLASDVAGLLGIHIYCFHVYATRLYHLQITALVSLWRLFRGKKWNPLRVRVDSAEFDPEQLFLGTLLFTLLLFLLPTTAVYYAVFSSLELCVKTVRCALRRIGGVSRTVWTLRMTDKEERTLRADKEGKSAKEGEELESIAFRVVKDVLMGRLI